MTLVYLTIAWLAGIVLAETVNLPWQALPVLGLAALLVLLLWRESARARLGAACALYNAEINQPRLWSRSTTIGSTRQRPAQRRSSASPITLPPQVARSLRYSHAPASG